MRVSALLVAAVLAGCSASAPTPTSTPATSPTASEVATAEPALTPSPSRSPEASPELTARDLRDEVQVGDIRAHLDEFQRIADENGGNRATGTPGFDASVEYVAGQLTAAGYEVTRQAFTVGDQSSVNLIVERAGADPQVVMLGAHLDSVEAGPGINDNGTGVGTLLVIAERLAKLPSPGRTVRIAFWGAEEGGPHGSPAYVAALPASELGRISSYLNFDMLGSPNPIRFVYAEAGAVEGSEAITALFTAHFDGEGMPWAPIDLTGHSDHGAFTVAGIPTGGLFSGGREPMTAEQAAAFDGRSGEPADPCSDQACDTIDNVNQAILDEMADAVAHAVGTMVAGD